MKSKQIYLIFCVLLSYSFISCTKTNSNNLNNNNFQIFPIVAKQNIYTSSTGEITLRIKSNTNTIQTYSFTVGNTDTIIYNGTNQISNSTFTLFSSATQDTTITIGFKTKVVGTRIVTLIVSNQSANIQTASVQFNVANLVGFAIDPIVANPNITTADTGKISLEISSDGTLNRTYSFAVGKDSIWYNNILRQAGSTFTLFTSASKDTTITIGFTTKVAGTRTVVLAVTDNATHPNTQTDSAQFNIANPVGITGFKVSANTINQNITNADTGQISLNIKSDGTFNRTYSFAVGSADSIWYKNTLQQPNTKFTLFTSATKDTTISIGFITKIVGTGTRTVMLSVTDNATPIDTQTASVTFYISSSSPAPPPISSRVLMGYWEDYTGGSNNPMRLKDINNNYNLIAVAFPVSLSNGGITFAVEPNIISNGGYTNALFISDMQQLHAQGKKIILSLGGELVTISLTTAAKEQTFVDSIKSILTQFPFDGIDLDVENGSPTAAGTIADPTDPGTKNMISAVTTIMSWYSATKGKSMVLTMVPQAANYQGGTSAYGGIWGSYLSWIYAFRNTLSYVSTQLYNTGSIQGLDGLNYNQGTADFIVSCTETSIKGFSAAGSGGMMLGIDPAKILVGLPAIPAAAGGGYTDPTTVKSAITYLLTGKNKPGSYTLQGSSYPTLGGMMTWDINWDGSQNYPYATNFASITWNP